MARRVSFIVAALALGTIACGKKGPPLAPIIRIPAAVTTLTAQRVGDDVYVLATLPERNIDGTQPVSTVGVDVWAYTGRTPPPRQKWVELGTRVGRVDLASASADSSTDPAPVDGPGPRQISVHERLTPELMTSALPAPPGAAAVPLRRFYVALPLGAHEKAGPAGTVADVDVGSRPGPPGELAMVYDASAVTLTWTPPRDGEAWVAAQRSSSRAAGVDVVESDESPWRFNVYRSGAPAVVPGRPAAAGVLGTLRPTPVNAAPLAKATISFPVVFGVETCVMVRAVFSGDGRVAEGEPAEQCVTPVDTFPPAAPKQLAALPSADAIDLIWEANDEPDLAGYHVLRADRPGAPLRRLTVEPVSVTRYRDAAVKAGVKYFYAVVAIDNRMPDPNVSGESNHVEEELR